MVGAILGRCGNAENFVGIVSAERVHRFEDRVAGGEGAGFVEHNDVQVGEALEGFATLEEDAHLRAAADSHGKRGRNRESHGARAGNDQHGNRVGERELQRVACENPDNKCDGGEHEDYGDEDGAGAVGKPLHGRARALRLLHHAGDLRQHRRFAQRLGAAGDGAVVVERAGQDAPARTALERRGFAGEHGFIHGGAAFDYNGIHREALAG